MSERRVLVIGGGDVGSAVAHQLFLRGMKVLISERERSTHARRGMAFTDALFDGHVVLEGVSAKLADSPQTVEQCWRSADCIPIVTLDERVLAAALRFDVAVDATMRREQRRPDLRTFAACAIGLGPGYEPGGNCHIAIETQWGASMGRVLRDCGTADRSGGPHPLDGITRGRFIIAPLAGIWRTSATLGQLVASGDAVGRIDGHILKAPIAGHLRGLTRDGVAVRAEQRLVEVDPRAVPELCGLGERPRAIARGVVEALQPLMDGDGR